MTDIDNRLLARMASVAIEIASGNRARGNRARGKGILLAAQAELRDEFHEFLRCWLKTARELNFLGSTPLPAQFQQTMTGEEDVAPSLKEEECGEPLGLDATDNSPSVLETHPNTDFSLAASSTHLALLFSRARLHYYRNGTFELDTHPHDVTLSAEQAKSVGMDVTMFRSMPGAWLAMFLGYLPFAVACGLGTMGFFEGLFGSMAFKFGFVGAYAMGAVLSLMRRHWRDRGWVR